jgi:hypothetical protein
VLQASRRLPGIRFEAQPPPPTVVLPRMDVTGFVGFAVSGPIDRPVPIEDAAQFAAVFGADLPIAWDARRGETSCAALGPAVRSFFRNGGRRCFVVRVAGEGARSTAFQLPGLIAIAGEGARHAMLQARSPGTWPDEIRVAVSVASSPLIVRPLSLRIGAFEIVSPAADAVQPGDLIRLPLQDWTLLATVGTATPLRSAQTWTVERERITVIRVDADELLWTQSAALLPGAAWRVGWIGPTGAASRAAAEVVEVRDRILLHVVTGFEQAPAIGSLIRLEDDDSEVWARVDDRERDGERTLLAFEAQRIRRSLPTGLPRSRARRAAQRVALELWADDGSYTRIGGLGFGATHPRFIADLPTDEALYEHATDAQYEETRELWRAAGQPRFPLAGPAERPKAYFPIAASLLPGPWLGALPPAGTPHRRNGLEDFRSSVFIDPRLEAVRASTLLGQADHIRSGIDQGESPRLHGVHALLGVDEVTLVAVPDAAHAGWSTVHPPTPGSPRVKEGGGQLDRGAFAECASTELRPPELTHTGDPAASTLSLAWDAAPTGGEVEVEEATDADFETAVEIYRGTRDELDIGARPSGAYWYRARFVVGSSVGPYSAIGPIGAASAPLALLRSPERYTDGVLVSVHRALVRMCSARGDLFAVLSLPEHYREEAALGHAATLRSGRAWPRTDVPPLGVGEAFALSYAALYHPWLVIANEDRPGEMRRVPPDGAAAGVFAGRAMDRGAWVAPANVAFLDVVALSPALASERRLELLQAQVNVVEQTPRGFLTLASDTLAVDAEVRPVNVRRLLQLLRRLALRHGETYAFEPNGEVLQGSAQQGFEAVLGALFRLGAFSGSRPDEGFRVVTGTPPNTRQSADNGQLIVELRVAPSRALAFLTVRLVRAGDGRLRVEAA